MLLVFFQTSAFHLNSSHLYLFRIICLERPLPYHLCIKNSNFHKIFFHHSICICFSISSLNSLFVFIYLHFYTFLVMFYLSATYFCHQSKPALKCFYLNSCCLIVVLPVFWFIFSVFLHCFSPLQPFSS